MKKLIGLALIMSMTVSGITIFAEDRGLNLPNQNNIEERHNSDSEKNLDTDIKPSNNYSEYEAKAIIVNNDNEWNNILEYGVISENGSTIEYNGIFYLYEDVLRNAREDDRSVSSLYGKNISTVSNYVKGNSPIGIGIYLRPGQTGTLDLTTSISKEVNANAGATINEVIEVGISQGYSTSYSNSGTIDVKNDTSSSGKYRLVPVYNVHTFDIYNDPWIGSDYKVGIGVYYEPVGVAAKKF